MSAGKNQNDIDIILFTHFHADHFGGIAGLVTQMKISGRKKTLKIILNEGLRKNLINYLSSTYLSLNNLGFELIIIEAELDSEIKLARDISFKLRKNTHISYKPDVKELGKESFISSSILFKYNKKNILYT